MSDQEMVPSSISAEVPDSEDDTVRIRAKQKIRLRRLGMATMGWGIAATVTTFTWWLGLLNFSAGEVVALLILIGLALLSFHLIIRRNWNLRLADPSLTMPHLLFGAVMGLGVISQADEARPALLLLYVMVMLYGLFGLKARQYLALAILASGGLGVIVAWDLASGQSYRDGQLIVMEWVLFTAVMLWMAFIGSHVSSLRDNLSQRNRDLRRISQRMKYLSEHDQLTRMPNRRRLMEQLQQMLDSADRNGVAFSLIMLDLDYFKRINDLHGHGVGDEVLEQFADRVRLSMRGGDRASQVDESVADIGRFGGEEFLAVLPKTDLDGALHAARRLLEHIRQAPFSTAAGPIACTASAGVAEHLPGESLASLLSRTDQALYMAKSNGRDRVMAASLK